MEAVHDFSIIHKEKCWEAVEKIAPCEDACPAGINIPGFIMAVAKGYVTEALAIIQDSMPIAGTLGRICHHPCEENCNRSIIDDPIGIMRLKRYAHDFGGANGPEIVSTGFPEGKKIAVIGSGPCGLTAGYFLNRLGYRVTLFEAEATPGGMLAYAIPEFILPHHVIEREIDNLQRKGIVIKTGTKLGKNLFIDEIWERGYRALLLAVGLQKSQMLDLPGIELNGVLPALSFLKEVRMGLRKGCRGKVLVIGGGNVAVDAARAAIRLGADQVDLACLETREQMPAFDWAILEGEKEGLKIHTPFAPQAFISRGNSRSLGRIELRKIKTLTTDAEGNLSWELDEGPEAQLTLNADIAIVAIGQSIDLNFLGNIDLNKDKWGNLLVGKHDFMTSHPGIFSAGDAITRGGTAAEAVGMGKKAATSIDAFIRGGGTLKEKAHNERGEIFTLAKEMIPSFFDKKHRWAEVRIPLQNRIRSFEEIDLGYTRTQAIEEAKRCLNCKMCGSCIFERGQICFDQASRILF